MNAKSAPRASALRGWRSGCMSLPRWSLAGQEVEEREQQDPHDVDEVPVQRGRLDGVVVTRRELAGHRSIQHDPEHDDAREDVRAVEAGQGEVRGPVRA